MKLCTDETSFICKSLEYGTVSGECVLSKATAKTVTEDLIVTTDRDSHIYAERHWAYNIFSPRAINGLNDGWKENIQTVEECQELCDIETSFECKSIDYSNIKKECCLSTHVWSTIN